MRNFRDVSFQAGSSHFSVIFRFATAEPKINDIHINKATIGACYSLNCYLSQLAAVVINYHS